MVFDWWLPLVQEFRKKVMDGDKDLAVIKRQLGVETR